jgi:hypothetical protein
MARAGIYKSEVKKARDTLLAQGKHPSIDAVRAELGNTGSKTTIHRYLKELEEEEGTGFGRGVAVSEAIQDRSDDLPSVCTKRPRRVSTSFRHGTLSRSPSVIRK